MPLRRKTAFYGEALLGGDRKKKSSAGTELKMTKCAEQPAAEKNPPETGENLLEGELLLKLIFERFALKRANGSKESPSEFPEALKKVS